MPRAPLRRTKIVATLGPAWETPAQMTALLDAGVNVVRINASHGTPEIRSRWVHQLRTVLDGRRDAAAVLLDLQGPRIRVGNLPSAIRLEQGQHV
ncbi:MAG TPA: pyruvate kinase, partial [Gemmatimonadales bacterium]|nr:pyruvate kinase [Gemmatimonadales bacterium]